MIGARALALFACACVAACSSEPASKPASKPAAQRQAATPPPAPAVTPQAAPEPVAEQQTPEPAPTSEGTGAWSIPKPELSRKPAAPDAVVLETAGAEPLRALRLAPTAGTSTEVSLSMKMQVAMTLGTQPIDPSVLPSIDVKMKVTTGRPKDGATPYAFEVVSAARDPLEGMSVRLEKAMDTAVEGMKATKGSLVFDDRGGRVSAEYGLPDVPTPGLRPSLAGFQQSFSQLFVVLPEEPVGKGAKWVSTSHFEISGIPVAQQSTYELRSVEGDTLKLAVSFVQSATGDADAPSGVAMEDTQFGGQGSGELTVSLGSPFPTAARAESRSRVVSSVTMGGQAQPVEMDLLSALAIEASAP